MSKIRAHLKAALTHLSLDDELDRLMNPRHTDHDVHAYLPQKVAAEVLEARNEIQAALDSLPADAP
jgi:hypothetical protein